ncbi:ATP synthase subunit I [Reinekea blandensis]|uniref:ATP synthase protein I n=1 Tax=Reinekea blandensis MED297 TaxID=314283 RepID=A4B9C7_9GAMM|nr:ATP synthase subunit I [Reinekea blandensis]EAR11228.1 hypothetical protein MED297_20112 [Reinekea sp. MED297] [Reinekea blandensis MED297]
MSYFKAHLPQKIARPVIWRVHLAQIIVLLAMTALTTGFAPILGLSMVIGGLIAVMGQFFFNIRALRQYGSPQVSSVIVATYRAMWGKWLIVIAGSLAAVVVFEELSAGVLFAGVFITHTVGALLLPVLVNRVAE